MNRFRGPGGLAAPAIGQLGWQVGHKAPRPIAAPYPQPQETRSHTEGVDTYRVLWDTADRTFAEMLVPPESQKMPGHTNTGGHMDIIQPQMSCWQKRDTPTTFQLFHVIRTITSLNHKERVELHQAPPDWRREALADAEIASASSPYQPDPSQRNYLRKRETILGHLSRTQRH